MANQEIETRLFQHGDEEAFRLLNEEWITKYFELEEKDRYTLNHPREVILEKGGAIVFVTLNGKPVGCCALVTIASHEYEVAKMGVTESAKGLGLGRRVLMATKKADARERSGCTWRRTTRSLRQFICTRRWAFSMCRWSG